MKVLLDTNVVIDVFQHRQKFFRDSYRIMRLVSESSIEGFISAGK
jgi:rRNA-processing protein FCF1